MQFCISVGISTSTSYLCSVGTWTVWSAPKTTCSPKMWCGCTPKCYVIGKKLYYSFSILEASIWHHTNGKLHLVVETSWWSTILIEQSISYAFNVQFLDKKLSMIHSGEVFIWEEGYNGDLHSIDHWSDVNGPCVGASMVHLDRGSSKVHPRVSVILVGIGARHLAVMRIGHTLTSGIIVKVDTMQFLHLSFS